jgi:hypothetical protein
MNCREETRMGYDEPSSLPRLSSCRQTRRAAISLCDGQGSTSRGGHHKNRTRRRLRDHRARFVSSLFALVELEQKAPSIARRARETRIPHRNGPVQYRQLKLSYYLNTGQHHVFTQDLFNSGARRYISHT